MDDELPFTFDDDDFQSSVSNDEVKFEPTESAGDIETSKEEKRKAFWLGKRKKNRERVKVSGTKDKYSKWRNVPISEIQFHLPRICVDFSYEDNMNDKEINSVGSQLMHAYLEKSKRPLYFHLTSFGGKLEDRMKDFDGFSDWKIFIDRQPFYELFDVSQVIYLSPEGDEVLEHLDDDKVYVIGAIADHNRLKGLSTNFARSIGVRSARLPIDQHVEGFPNVSLNINHVVEILVNYAEKKDWKEALLGSLPTRKSYQKPQTTSA